MSSLEHGWTALVSGENRAWWAPAARAGLGALSLPYAGGIGLYRSFFDFGLIQPTRLPCGVLSVGNITMGGAGKTTTVRWLVRRLQEWGARPAILSRGYRAGGTQDPKAVIVVAGPEGLREDARIGGDEPVLLARSLPGVPVLIGKRRLVSGARACEEFSANVVVLDDAYQYWRLQKDLEIVLLDAANPFGYGSVFPRGALREPLRGLRRAHAAILTHATWADSGERDRLRATLAKRMPGAIVAEARHVPRRLREHQGGGEVELDALGRGRWLAVSGLGRPDAFERTLVELKAANVEGARFPDHHAYTEQDIRDLVERVRVGGMAGLVTTEKDAVKILPEWLGGVRCLVLEIDLEFLAGQAEIESLMRTRLSASLATAPTP